MTISILVVTALTACQREDNKDLPDPRPVLSFVVKATPAANLRVPGVIESKIETPLSFKVLGRVIARDVGVGDIVRRNDTIAAINALPLELAVKAATADLTNAQAQQANAAVNEQRQRTLAQSRSASEASLEEAQRVSQTADAGVLRAQANLDRTQQQLTYAQLRADFDGVVTATSAEIGEVVSPGQTIVTIARPDLLEAVIDIPQSDMDNVAVGSPFDAALQLDMSICARGVVREIAPSADTVTRTQRIRISLKDPPPGFRLGAVVTVSTPIHNESALLAPESAMLVEDGKSSVWVVDEQRALVHLLKVEPDNSQLQPGMVRIAKGISEGDRVVVAGVHSLHDGQKIRLDRN